MPRPKTSASRALSDIGAAATSVATERILRSERCGRRITDDAAQSTLKFKLLYTGLKRSRLISAHFVKHFLRARGNRRIGCRRIVRHVKSDAINCTLRSAATVGKLTLDIACVLQRLISQSANCVIGLARNSRLVVRHTAYSIFQIVKIHGVAQTRFGHRLSTGIPVAAKKSASAKNKGKQDNHDPAAATAAPTVTIVISSNSRYVAQRIVVYCTQSFHFLIYYNRVALRDYNHIFLRGLSKRHNTGTCSNKCSF